MSYEVVTIALLSLRGVGPGTVRTLWQRYPSMRTEPDVIDVLRESHNSRINGASGTGISDAFDEARRLIDRCERERIHVLAPANGGFPTSLRTIPNAPLLLFARGNFLCLSAACVAIIGTREPTSYGEGAARKMAKNLAESGWTIVSGLAEGCDTAGHEGCLDGGGQTAAFLAHGFGRIYPAKNKALAERIVATGGCLLTEYSPGTPPTRGAFVERDRLQSGASLGVIVIETDVKGGTMHTVRHAQEQARPLAALLHPEDRRHEPKVQGNLLLIMEGRAYPLKDRADVTAFVTQLQSQRTSAPIDVQGQVQGEFGSV